MGSRFLASLIATFLVTLVLLVGASYAVTKMTVTTPRDPFRTGSFEFDLAPGWWCELDGTEHVCVPKGEPPHSAIAVIAIKERNENDNLAIYEAYLRKPQRADRTKNDGPLSEIRFVGRRKLGDVTWVESLHIGSEIAGFHTYYLGTTTSHLGILVTLSVRAEREAEYIAEIKKMMESLVLYQR